MPSLFGMTHAPMGVGVFVVQKSFQAWHLVVSCTRSKPSLSCSGGPLCTHVEATRPASDVSQAGTLRVWFSITILSGPWLLRSAVGGWGQAHPPGPQRVLYRCSQNTTPSSSFISPSLGFKTIGVPTLPRGKDDCSIHFTHPCSSG